jgi:hypothetical protein
MENDDWLNYKIQIRERLRIFALKILELSEMFPNSNRGRILNNQVTRSGSSTYAKPGTVENTCFDAKAYR